MNTCVYTFILWGVLGHFNGGGIWGHSLVTVAATLKSNKHKLSNYRQNDNSPSKRCFEIEGANEVRNTQNEPSLSLQNICIVHITNSFNREKQ